MPLRGREEELALLEGFLARALAGEQQLVLLQGDPGIGKTALLQAFASVRRPRRDRPRFFHLRAPADGRYEPIHHAALAATSRRLYARLGGQRQATEVARSLAAEWLGAVPVWGDLLGAVAATADVLDRRRRERRFKEIDTLDEEIDALIQAARRRPLVLLLDELEQAREESISRLASLVEIADAGARILIVGAYRPTAPGIPDPPVHTLRHTLPLKGEFFVHRQLRAIGPDALRAAAADRLGGEPDRELAAWLAESTGGHPAALDDTVQRLRDAGALRREGDRWAADRARLDEAAPSAALVDLGGLGEATVRLLGAAAALGTEFHSTALATATGRDELQVEDGLAIAVRAGVLDHLGERDDADGEPATWYRFSSPHLRAAVQRPIAAGPAARAGAALVGALLVLAAGCGGEGGAPGPAAEPQPGGTAVVGGAVDLRTMNPLTVNESYGRMFQNEVLYAPLLRYGERFQVQPWLAERWDTARVAPDTLELTFHLRPDVAWHDGTPTTAADVAFTLDRARAPELASPLATDLSYYAPGAVVTGEREVRVRFRPHADFLDVWTRMALLPRHLLADVPPAELASHPFGGERPVGNGPFRFVRRVPNQEWVFEANPAFPAALGGRPLLDRLVYRVIPEPSARLTALLTGEIDVQLGVTPAHAAQIAAGQGTEVLTGPSSSLTFVAWNGQLPWFDSPAERRALGMAIDRSAIVGALLEGYADPGRATVTPAHPAFAPDDPGTSLAHDPAAARALLAGAGWADRDGDGTLEDGAGRPFRFTLTTVAGNQSHADLAQLLQAQLRQVGVDVRTRAVEGHTLIGMIEGRSGAGGRRARDYEAVVMGISESARKDDRPYFHSRFRDDPRQITSFSDARADLLMDTVGVILDPRQARPFWVEYQRLMAQQAPFAVLYYPKRLAAASRRLGGVAVDGRGELAQVTRWHVAQAAP